jgi:fructokinase
MKKSILSFGEILYDIFPSYERLGGAPFNFAYHMHSLGFSCFMISRVGDDELGRGIMDFLTTSLGSESMQKDRHHTTGRVLVKVDEKGVPEFDIMEDAAYDYVEYDEAVQDAVDREPGLIYFGTLAQRNSTSRSTLQNILSHDDSGIRLYDMNLRKNCYSMRHRKVK